MVSVVVVIRLLLATLFWWYMIEQILAIMSTIGTILIHYGLSKDCI